MLSIRFLLFILYLLYNAAVIINGMGGANEVKNILEPRQLRKKMNGTHKW